MLHDSFEYVMEVSSKKLILTELFSNKLDEHLKNNNLKLISNSNVERAFNLLEFFNKTQINI